MRLGLKSSATEAHDFPVRRSSAYGTEAHPGNVYVGLRLRNAPESALRSTPGHFFRGARAQRSRDRGARIGGTQARSRVGTPAHRLCMAPIAIRAVCRRRVDGVGETSSERGLFAGDRSDLWDWSPVARGWNWGDLPTISGIARCDVGLFVRSTYRYDSAVRSWSRAWCVHCPRHNGAGPRPHEYGRCGDGESPRCGPNGPAAIQGTPWCATRGCNRRRAVT